MSFAVTTIAGRLGDDPEKREINDDTTVTTFSVAVDQYMGKGKDKTTGWWNVEVWGPLQQVAKWLKKGQQVSVAGELRQDRKQRDGETVVFYKIRANSIMLGGGGEDASDGERVRRESGKPKKAAEPDDDDPF